MGIAKGVNSSALKRLNLNKYEGTCIGLADGKVVAKNHSIKIVMRELIERHGNKKIAVINVPKKNKIFIL